MAEVSDVPLTVAAAHQHNFVAAIDAKSVEVNKTVVGPVDANPVGLAQTVAEVVAHTQLHETAQHLQLQYFLLPSASLSLLSSSSFLPLESDRSCTEHDQPTHTNQ